MLPTWTRDSVNAKRLICLRTARRAIKIFLAARQVYSDNYFLVGLKYHLKMPRHIQRYYFLEWCVCMCELAALTSPSHNTHAIFLALAKQLLCGSGRQNSYTTFIQVEVSYQHAHRRGAGKVCKSFYCAAALLLPECDYCYALCAFSPCPRVLHIQVRAEQRTLEARDEALKLITNNK
jgi:hypothetical protein